MLRRCISAMDEIAPFPDRLDTDHFAGDQCMDRLRQLLPKPRGIRHQRVVQSAWRLRPVFYGEFFLPILIAIVSYMWRLEHLNQNWKCR